MIENLLQNLKKKNILIVGDVVLDRYVYCTTERISSETTIPVFLSNAEAFALGGSGNVAMNVVAGGQNAFLCSIVGADFVGSKITSLLGDFCINSEYLIVDQKACNTVKTRFLNNLNQQVFRCDDEHKATLDAATEQGLLDRIESDIKRFDGIILADYSNGFLSFGLTKRLLSIANKNEVPVMVDIRNDQPQKYVGATFIKPNVKDLAALVGRKSHCRNDIIRDSCELCGILKSEYVLTTCGSDGMILVDGNKVVADELACRKDVADVTGAGDTVSAYFIIGIACGMTPENATKLANIAAGIKVQKVGTLPVLYCELSGFYNSAKIIDANNLPNVLSLFLGKQIVFTNGCFDVVHIGHLRYLKEAKQNGDILIVGLNSDASVKRLKGAERPINNQDVRAEFLANLDFVDYIVIFDDDTSENLIKTINPYMFVKGGDYSPENIPEYEVAVGVGAIVKVINTSTDISSSAMLSKIYGG